jgi:glycosyltransferase involved in cell wall biosynthesis
MKKNIVSVIVPTLAEKNRETQLKRCINSIRNSSITDILIIVVVNGNRFDKGLCDWLKQQPDILFDYQPTPSSPLAQLRGRQLIKTPFFAFIDDDDEYLPNAIDLRLAKMKDNPNIDIVITNGFTFILGKDQRHYPNMSGISEDPLKKLFDCAWLHNCNALFRSNSVGIAFFEDIHPYAEWTWLAFKLSSQGIKIGTLDEPTFRYYDTPNSLSKCDAYNDTFFELYQKMLSLSPPPKIVRLINNRISANWHNRSVKALENNQLPDAFIYHIRSLSTLKGLLYLSYSRHLFLKWIEPIFFRKK